MIQKIWLLTGVIFLPFWNALTSFKYSVIKDGSLRFPNARIHPIVRIDPTKVEKVASLEIKPKRGCPYFLPGDWYKLSETFEQRRSRDPKYQTAHEFIVQKLQINKTSEARAVQQAIESKGHYRGFSSSAAYISKVESLYASLQRDGFKETFLERLFPWKNGLECAVGPGLELIKINGGNHRFVGARLIGLTAVPVQICVVHDSYYKKNVDSVRTIKIISEAVYEKYRSY
jgi:hypothetical protein